MLQSGMHPLLAKQIMTLQLIRVKCALDSMAMKRCEKYFYGEQCIPFYRSPQDLTSVTVVTSRIGIRPIPVWDMSDTGIGWRVAAQNRNSKTGTRNRNT